MQDQAIPPAVLQVARALMDVIKPHMGATSERTGNGGHPLLSIDEAARKLRVSRMTVERSIKSGEFPAVRFRRTYRVPRAFVDRLIAAADAGEHVVVEEYAADWISEHGETASVQGVA